MSESTLKWIVSIIMPLVGIFYVTTIVEMLDSEREWIRITGVVILMITTILVIRLNLEGV